MKLRFCHIYFQQFHQIFLFKKAHFRIISIFKMFLLECQRISLVQQELHALKNLV